MKKETVSAKFNYKDKKYKKVNLWVCCAYVLFVIKNNSYRIVDDNKSNVSLSDYFWVSLRAGNEKK